MPEPRILIVDDSPTIRNALSKKLKSMGADVTLAVDGRNGLETALECGFDLIITDVDMPRMSGLELCEELKKRSETKAVPVIILSSRDKDEDIENGFRVGAATYVSKTRAPIELADRIREVLDKATFLKERLVMVVDDSETVRQTVVDGLVREGFQVVAASNGEEALILLHEDIPDLVLTDLNMPVMDGKALCKAMSLEPKLANVPVVVMSRESDRAVMRRLLQEGAAAFLTKPFNTEQVVITIEKLLSDQFRLLLEEKERLSSEQSLILASISSLVNALEARDQYTRGHSESVARIAAGIGEVMGFERADIERLRIAARLHDLGKIGVRDNVLLKQGRLTDEEYEAIKQHTIVGETILRPIPSMADILEAAGSHHEQWDGSGYPRGLAGEEIPLWGRLIAVADTYDALTSDRPYRKGMAVDKALSIVRECRGSQLCPVCVDAFVDYLLRHENGSGNGNGNGAENDTEESQG
ncbi:MAG: response regulator [Desulfovibrionaceae bacterium]